MKILMLALSISFSAYGKRCDKIETINPDILVGRCSDGTISFSNKTPYKGSAKLSKYEGSCGAEAAANVFHAYCDRKLISPEYLMRTYFGDITPGVRPDTLKDGLNKLFADYPADCANGVWAHYFARSSSSFIQNIQKDLTDGVTSWERHEVKKVSPVIVLLSPPNSNNLHYVTIVDVMDFSQAEDLEAYNNRHCKVIYNDMRRQRQAPCDKFAEWTSTANNSLFTFWMHEFNYFKFVQ